MKKIKNKISKKYKRKFNVKLIKYNLTYSTQEVANLFNTTINTVSNWYKIGLQRIDNKKPSLVFGADLIKFLKNKQKRRKQKCAINEFYCCKCKLTRKPWENAVDIIYIDTKRIMIIGLCERCSSKIHKIASVVNLMELKKTFNVQMIQNKHLIDCVNTNTIVT